MKLALVETKPSLPTDADEVAATLAALYRETQTAQRSLAKVSHLIERLAAAMPANEF